MHLGDVDGLGAQPRLFIGGQGGATADVMGEVVRCAVSSANQGAGADADGA